MNKSFITISTIVRGITILLLLWALADNPYEYYQFLRWVVMAVFGLTAYLAYTQHKIWWMGGMLAISILFNPIFPFYLDREVWILIDLFVAIILFISIFTVKQEEGNEIANDRILPYDMRGTDDYERNEEEMIKTRNSNSKRTKKAYVVTSNNSPKYCSQCGKEIPNDSKFCTFCGNKCSV